MTASQTGAGTMDSAGALSIPALAELPAAEFEAADRRWRICGLDEQDHIFRTVAAESGFYEVGLLTLLKQLVSPGSHAVDVGANIGNHTLWFAGAMGCTVRSFEPLPALCSVLAHNVAQNLLDSSVRVEPYGVGRKRGIAAITTWDAANSGASALETTRSGGTIPVVALDDLQWDRPVDLIKIDVEGMELAVLDGALGLIRRDRPILVVEARTNEEQVELREWLERAGYLVLATVNATPTLIAVAGGPQPPIEPLAIAVEQLTQRFDGFEQRLDRFGRYIFSASERFAQSPAAARSQDAEPKTPAAQPQLIETLQQRIKHLENRLSAMQCREAGTETCNHIPTGEIRS